ncbi:MAG: hypothetical protein NTY93_02715, partial [Candidatus Kaiserbacteria bacterium]|nr:hypothetical protein [Candidatus Kaiserbacteria bacterium]
MSKITRFFGGAVFAAVLLLGAGTLPVQASSGLTNTQIQAILSVLSSFGASSATIANVNAALGGTTTTSTAPAITQIHWAAGVMDVASTTISIRGTNLQGATKVNFYNATGQLVQSAVVQYAANAGPNSLVIFSSSPG